MTVICSAPQRFSSNGMMPGSSMFLEWTEGYLFDYSMFYAVGGLFPLCLSSVIDT